MGDELHFHLWVWVHDNDAAAGGRLFEAQKNKTKAASSMGGSDSWPGTH